MNNRNTEKSRVLEQMNEIRFNKSGLILRAVFWSGLALLLTQTLLREWQVYLYFLALGLFAINANPLIFLRKAAFFYDDNSCQYYSSFLKKGQMDLKNIRNVTLLESNGVYIGTQNSSFWTSGSYRLYFYDFQGQKTIVQFSNKDSINRSDLQKFLSFCNQKGIKTQKGQGYD